MPGINSWLRQKCVTEVLKKWASVLASFCSRGAILAFAVHVSVGSGFDLHTIGYILMAVGGLGIVLSLVFWSSWMGPGGGRSRTDAYGSPPPPGV